MADSAIKLFPAEVSLAPLATAILGGVGRVDGHLVARYRLVPDDRLVFRVRVGSQPDLIGKKYEPVLGVWSRFQVAPAEPGVPRGSTSTLPAASLSQAVPPLASPAASPPDPVAPGASPPEDIGVVVDIGVREAYGRAWVNALKQHGRSCETMIPAYQVRAQILGFLADNGV
jgi:hypothetical protein